MMKQNSTKNSRSIGRCLLYIEVIYHIYSICDMLNKKLYYNYNNKQPKIHRIT